MRLSKRQLEPDLPNELTPPRDPVGFDKLTPKAVMSVSGQALSRWTEIVLIEDNSARAERRVTPGAGDLTANGRVVIRVHRIGVGGLVHAAETSYTPVLRARSDPDRSSYALGLLDGLDLASGSVIVSGSSYGSNSRFLGGLLARGLTAVVEVRPSSRVSPVALPRSPNDAGSTSVRDLLGATSWSDYVVPVAGSEEHRVRYSVASLGAIRLEGGSIGQLFAAETGAIAGIHRGTVFGLSTDPDATLEQLLEAVGWARWIRPVVRRLERDAIRVAETRPASAHSRTRAGRLQLRANIKLSRRHDQAAAAQRAALGSQPILRGHLTKGLPSVNVVELFAGAGGMGLGFLMAGGEPGYRILFSGEVDPIYVQSLRRNQSSFAQLQPDRQGTTPEHVTPIDLRDIDVEHDIVRRANAAGGAHVVIGGPPCQGFSNANRNSWRSSNPHNLLVDVYLRYVEQLRPRVFLLENVQGIDWTPPKSGTATAPSVLDHVRARMTAAGYQVFVKLLDAVWYGVPQYRSRFFVLGIHKDLGYRSDAFGDWGPFPQPTHGPGTDREYVTVKDALADLPGIGNGHDEGAMTYREPRASSLARNPFLGEMRRGAPRGLITDHVTSLHAEYVIERYKAVPQGGNWVDIVEKLSNYADAKRTHSNIYRRLAWSEPSITIGHYRKSMLIHPAQDRGLSLREASRLQSIPDWFRFAGREDDAPGGLMHKQQQLANAVSPNLTRAIAEFILRL